MGHGNGVNDQTTKVKIETRHGR